MGRGFASPRERRRATRAGSCGSRAARGSRAKKGEGAKRTKCARRSKAAAAAPPVRRPLDREEAKRLHEKGLSIREIAERLGYAYPTVRLALRAEGVKREPPMKRSGKWSRVLYDGRKVERLRAQLRGGIGCWRMRKHPLRRPATPSRGPRREHLDAGPTR